MTLVTPAGTVKMKVPAVSKTCMFGIGLALAVTLVKPLPSPVKDPVKLLALLLNVTGLV
jgi:hypothetical protein